MIDTSACAIAFRRIAGPVADEIAILCRPENSSADTIQQVEVVYRELAAFLAAQQASFGNLTCETLFLRDIRRDQPVLLEVRSRVLAGLGQGAGAPQPALIQQAPVSRGTSFELLASAVVPRRLDAWCVSDVRASPPCGCEGCSRSGARIVRLGDQQSLYTSTVYGAGGDAFEQAWNMFGAAERLLDQCGMGFRDVVRTWIHLRDIDRDYEALNKARSAFFRRTGVELRPASTGVQGLPFPDVHDFSMTLHALKTPRQLDARLMSTPLLTEAWSYGVDFSRGLKVTEANKVTLHVSGTASIDEAGRTVHVGRFDAQVDRMLDNIGSLLARQGADVENVVSAVTYLKDASEAPVLRAICERRGFDGFPCVLVEAPLCRPELLCETELVAVLPLVTAGA